MSPLPVVSAAEAVRAFEALGWRVVRGGNHIILTREDHPATLSIPNHKEVARGTLRSLIRAAGLTVEEFVAALEL
jgi:predicted RNA binding protein YcfA (HicA-like mRNA interferase family)